MSESERGTSPNWVVLLDKLKQKESIASDSKLAETLGVTRGFISAVRSGRKNLSLKLAQSVFSRLGQTIDPESIERLFVPGKVLAYTSRLSALRELVIQRSNGYCELCEMPAPFKDAKGQPFLELHHLVPARDGVSDTLDNSVALCPNCHRKMDYCATEADKEKLQAVVASYKDSTPVPTIDR